MNISRQILLKCACIVGGILVSANSYSGMGTSGSILDTEFGKLQIFPKDNMWNVDISRYPVHPYSSKYIESMGSDKGLHADFGSSYRGNKPGFPYHVVGKEISRSIITFRYAEESDRVPYPIPEQPLIEQGGDRHILLIDYPYKKLYELYAVSKDGASWKAGSGAVFSLDSNNLRPKGFTSADAAGLPIFPGLVRYDEIIRGEIHHALRVTVKKTQRGFVYPARHFASRSDDTNLPPMGLRLRLKADFDISSFPMSVRVILKAMKQYGVMIADNGSDWFISGTYDERWDNEVLQSIKRVKGSDFEAIYTDVIEK